MFYNVCYRRAVVIVNSALELLNMHILQPKHTRLKPDEVKRLLAKYNVSLSQLPKIKITDPAVPENFNVGDVLKIERKEDDKIKPYFRVIVS